MERKAKSHKIILTIMDKDHIDEEKFMTDVEEAINDYGYFVAEIRSLEE